MNRMPVDAQRRFFDRLGERRMGVAGARAILGGGGELDAQRHFGNQIAGLGADDMATHDPIGLGVGENFDEALGVAVGAGAAVGRERELADLIGGALGLQLLLGLAEVGDLGPGVD